VAGEQLLFTLSAEDLISGPTGDAIRSLEKLETTVGKLSDVGKRSASGSREAAQGLNLATEAAKKSTTSNEAANQAMRLVTIQLGQIAGASSAANGALSVLSTVMSQVLVAGKALSPAFLAFTIAAAAAGAAMKVFSEGSKKAREEVEALQKKNLDAVLSMNQLTQAARGVAAQGAAEMGRKIDDLKGKIGDAETEMRKLQERAVNLSKATTIGFTSEVSLRQVEGPKLDMGPINAQIDESRRTIANLRLELQTAEKTYRDLTAASAGTGAEARRSGNLILQAAAAQRNELSAYVNQVERATNASRIFSDFSADGMNRIKEVAAETGSTWAELADVATKQTLVMRDAVVQSALAMGEALGNAISGTKDSWRNALKTLVGFFFDAVTQIVLASAVANKAVTAMLIPGSFVAILGIAAALQGIKAIAINALSGATSAAAGAGNAAPAAPATSGAGAASGTATTGGQSLATAQREVTNNIQVSLPVQALDLASISDIQLKAFANRVGRAIREAAATGQFSTVSA
jgi:hypothetical protein